MQTASEMQMLNEDIQHKLQLQVDHNSFLEQKVKMQNESIKLLTKEMRATKEESSVGTMQNIRYIAVILSLHIYDT
jgi:hypothetical protein